jgi:DNA-binding SARP family transcriptional activator
VIPRISLAGRVAVEVAGTTLDERALAGRQARLTFAMLVIERHRPLPRDELADNLWPQVRPDTWEATLRGIVSRVRDYVVTSGLGPRELLRADDGTYRLELPTDVEVDLEQAVAWVDAAATALAAEDPARAAAAAAWARSVLVRPLLSGVDAPWLAQQRRERTGDLSRALELLAEARLQLGDHPHATAAAEAAVGLDPFRESAHRLLVRSLAAAGNGAAALRAYEQCRRMLADELGVDPSPDTEQLHSELLFADAATTVRLGSDPGPTAAGSATRSAGAGVAVGGPPYLGLQTFEERHAQWFFGRSADVVRALERLADARFLALIGPSGSGTSSLARAGLVVALRDGALPDADTWDIHVLRPGPDPLGSVARELDHAERDPAVPLLLVVDGLEEVFTLCRDEDARRVFLDRLAALATDPATDTRVVVTLRADLYARLSDHPLLADLASAHQFLVTTMDEVALAEAIEGPAAASGLRLEPGLTETMLRDVARRPGALPLLQHALLEVWRRRVGATMTLAAYRAAGGIEGAIAQRAETVYDRLSADEQTVARQLLLRLIEPGEGGDDTRRRVGFAELATATERERIEHIVETFARARLVTTSGDPDGSRHVELFHEALIRSWPRLRGWIDDGRAGLLVHRRLSAAAAEWRRLGRDAGALYRGPRLAEAAAWAQRNPGVSNELERSFLTASLAAEDADRRRRLRRLRWIIVGLTIGLVTAVTLALVTLVRSDRPSAEGRTDGAREPATAASAALEVDPERHLLALAVVDVTHPGRGMGQRGPVVRS